MQHDLGARLRDLRRRHNLSQRQLALRAGITNATISLIESNQVNPSVGVLKKVLDGVPISLADFFTTETDEPPRVFFASHELTEIANGPISYRLVGNNLGRQSVQMLLELYQPGSDSGRILLRHEGEEGGIVISGRLEVTVGNQQRILESGEAYYFASSIPHRFRNIDRKVCKVVSACTPPNF